jgi:hypothetical protein
LDRGRSGRAASALWGVSNDEASPAGHPKERVRCSDGSGPRTLRVNSRKRRQSAPKAGDCPTPRCCRGRSGRRGRRQRRRGRGEELCYQLLPRAWRRRKRGCMQRPEESAAAIHGRHRCCTHHSPYPLVDGRDGRLEEPQVLALKDRSR